MKLELDASTGPFNLIREAREMGGLYGGHGIICSMLFPIATPVAANFLRHIQYEYLPFVGIDNPSPAHIGTIYNSYWLYVNWATKEIDYDEVGTFTEAGLRVASLMNAYFSEE